MKDELIDRYQKQRKADEKELRELKSRLKKMGVDMDGISSKDSSSLEDITTRYQKQRKADEKELRELKSRLGTLNKQAAKEKKQREADERELLALKEELGMVKKSEKPKDKKRGFVSFVKSILYRSFLKTLFGARVYTDFKNFWDR